MEDHCNVKNLVSRCQLKKAPEQVSVQDHLDKILSQRNNKLASQRHLKICVTNSLVVKLQYISARTKLIIWLRIV